MDLKPVKFEHHETTTINVLKQPRAAILQKNSTINEKKLDTNSDRINIIKPKVDEDPAYTIVKASKTSIKDLENCSWIKHSKILKPAQEYKYHIQNDNKEKPFTCSLCDKSFRLKSYVKLHWDTIHNSHRPTFDCHQCNESFITNIQIRNHLRATKHNLSLEKTYDCNHCNQKFVYQQSLHVHSRIHNRRPFKCSECHKTFALNRSLQQHFCKNVKDPFIGKITHDCNICHKKLMYSHSLQKHLAMHARLEESKAELATAKKRLFVCPWENCGRTFKRINDGYRYHIRIHKNEKPYKCSSCDKYFRSATHLKSHSIEQHDPHRPTYECHHCNASFKRKSCIKLHLKAHIKDNFNVITRPRRIYPESEKKFSCKDCGKRYMRLDTLKNHRELHRRKKPYKCSQCSKTYEYKKNFIRHLKMDGHNLKMTHLKREPKDDEIETVTVKKEINSSTKESCDSFASGTLSIDCKREEKMKRNINKKDMPSQDHQIVNFWPNRYDKMCHNTEHDLNVYKNFNRRLESFVTWPKKFTPKPLELSDAGFFYTKIADRVKCFSCCIVLEGWGIGEHPMDEHIVWAIEWYLNQIKSDTYLRIRKKQIEDEKFSDEV